jgi:serine/threonine protein kinase
MGTMNEGALLDTLSSEQKKSLQAPAAEAPALPSGVMRFQLGRELGHGGMGRVVEAVDKQFNRVVAVKELLSDTPAARARFATEALITGNLEHAGIPSVYERGADDVGRPFYAMRKVTGRTLAALLGDARTLAERLALLPSVLRATQTLGYAHERGVIHRDVKPDNVIVGAHGDVVLLDWGIARMRGLAASPSGSSSGAEEAPTLPPGSGGTMYGAVIGTPAYMSPEQAAGHSDEIDERTDVFALGAMLYHLLTGRMPYSGSTSTEVLELARAGRPPDVMSLEPQAPAALAAICARAMARLPSERFRNASELAHALEEFESQALSFSPGSKWIGPVINVAMFLLIAMSLSFAWLGLRKISSFQEMGTGAWASIMAGVFALGLNAIEWFTRGRYALSSFSLALAFTTMCGAFISISTGIGEIFQGAEFVATDPDKFRHVVSRGLWEVSGSLSFGLMIAGTQFLLWAIVQRRVQLSQQRSTVPSRTSQTTTRPA